MLEWLQPILQQSLQFARVMVELLVVSVLMPWRVSLALLIVGILIFWLFWRILPWVLRVLVQALARFVELLVSLLLLPEYLITRQLRTIGWGPIWGSYMYGDLLGGVVRLFYAPVDGLERWRGWRFPWFALILLTALPVGLWYVRPFMQGVEAASYIDAGFHFWYQFEARLLQGTV